MRVKVPKGYDTVPGKRVTIPLMLSWAQQRKLIFLFTLLLIVGAAFGAYGLFAWMDKPSCFDGEKNGAERGIDCGGVCARMCPIDIEPPVVVFARALEIKEGLWSAVAYLENRNAGAGARNVPYRFKLYDADSLLIFERRGVTPIPPRKSFAVFESRMETGDRIPTRATFELLESPSFFRMTEPKLDLTTREFTTDASGSRLRAVLGNPSPAGISDIVATALLYDEEGNVIAAASTAVKKLAGQGSTDIVFTWPMELPIPDRTEILYSVKN